MKRPPHLPLADQLRRRRGETAELHAITPGADRARQVRRVLGEAVRRAFRTHDDGFAGFALVTWDMQGGACSSYAAEAGPVAEALVPTYVHDVLNRGVAVALAGGADEITGEGA